MFIHRAAALAHPNIALIKYWGNRDNEMRLPANGSISMNLAGLETRTSVSFDQSNHEDTLIINGREETGQGLLRIQKFLDLVRQMAGFSLPATVASESNFPIGAGVASSAAAFAALALAGAQAAGLTLSEADLSRLARRGSGSACRSIPGGFVEWEMGTNDIDSYATSIYASDYWDLIDCIVILSQEAKQIGSAAGHSLAGTSPLQASRVWDAPRRLGICRNAIKERDFSALAEVVELDSNMMHAVMMTSQPPIFYWQEITLTIMQIVREARLKGFPVCYTIDAGPNVHVITESSIMSQITSLFSDLPGVKEVRVAQVGGPARLL